MQYVRSPRQLVRELLMLDDTPHSIALGTAIGMAVGLTPTVGIQMIIVVIIAFLTRPFFHFNRLAALLTVYISNPLTMIPIYIFDYHVGRLFVAGSGDVSKFGKILHYNGFQEWWNAIVSLFVEFGTPLVVGAAVVGTIGGVATYPVMRWLLKSMRRPAAASPKTPPAVDQTVEKSASAE